MLGLMQDWPLTVDRLLDHAAAWHGAREIVSRDAQGLVTRSSYAQVHADAKRVSNALARAGIRLGDRVATLGWNGARHLAAWYGIAGMGAVCHTLNPRLFPEQLAYIAGEAEDRVLIADPACAALIPALLASVPSIELVVFLCDRAGLPAADFEAIAFDDWIAGESADFQWGDFDERTACGLCYTSGTTGNPKGVLYAHRSNYLHALMALQRDALALSARDTALLVVPMYHANAWGVVYAAPAAGAKLVLPGQNLDGASLYELIESEGVTYAGGVPTVWQALLQHVQTTGARFTTLERATIGGSACPESIIRAFRDYGVDVIQGWGMTETSPLATISVPTAEVAAMDEDAQIAHKLKQGRALCGIELKLTDDDGNRLPHDGRTPGRLKVKGATVASGYYAGAGGNVLDSEGFFDTGDVSTIDARGYVQITDRAKDIVKSGGEWISSIDIENIVVGHPKAQYAAVIGVTHPKWDERPILLVQLKDGEASDGSEFLTWLDGKVAKWWVPDDVLIVDEIPLGPTGKVDKKILRTRLEGYSLPFSSAER
ncbi:long-chain-fatty-acid--CoA ligase [Sphingosinicella soli]|uniref:Fatty-acyl-CoA synthase n=1 Tax=Sphingosinicella soli TaxID=333708 RepID=A0A7W7B2D0_9SPHN|nr:long-chain-fatty-acid--CoA ligase [Sphingosinicella soli]MBB4632740.1 fatty-acyl-CoA synthase [Sphingosinicella soli]